MYNTSCRVRKRLEAHSIKPILSFSLIFIKFMEVNCIDSVLVSEQWLLAMIFIENDSIWNIWKFQFKVLEIEGLVRFWSVGGLVECEWYKPQWFRILSISGLAFRFVSPWTTGQTSVRWIVAGHVSRTVASWCGTFELLRMCLDLGTIGTRTTRQAVKETKISVLLNLVYIYHDDFALLLLR